MNVILPATSPSLKGILRHSVKNTYIDRDYVPDEDNDIDFSIKTHVRTINNYADDVPMEDTDLLGVNVYVNDDVIVDEDTDPGDSLLYYSCSNVDLKTDSIAINLI